MLGFSYALHRRPLKYVYMIYQWATIALVRGPYWIVVSIPRSWRPRSSWSLKKTLFIKLLRHLGHLQLNVVGSLRFLPDHHAIAIANDTEELHIEGIWLDPITSHIIVGKLEMWCFVASIDPSTIPGYWMHKKSAKIDVGSPPLPDEKVIFYFHGGGFTQGSAHPSDVTSNIPLGLLQEGRCKSVSRVLSLEYRLTKLPPFPPTNPFPAQLLDALAGYSYLVEKVGFHPEDIIVAGDSPGAHLALQLTRYLLEYESQLPTLRKPGAIALLSPWADPGCSHLSPSGDDSYTKFKSSDFLADSYRTREAAIAGVFGLGFTDHNPYMSPASLILPQPIEVDFKRFPRKFIANGGAERLRDCIRTLATKMEEVEAGMTYHEAPDAVHDWTIFKFWEPERSQSLDLIGKWIDAGDTQL